MYLKTKSHKEHYSVKRTMERAVYVAHHYLFDDDLMLRLLHLARLTCPVDGDYQSIVVPDITSEYVRQDAKKHKLPAVCYLSTVMMLEALVNHKGTGRKNISDKETIQSLTLRIKRLENRLAILEDDSFKATVVSLAQVDPRDLWKMSHEVLVEIAYTIGLTVQAEWSKDTLVERVAECLGKKYGAFKRDSI